ncbi:hypothetical protein M8J76_005361 [Diaphorina citri]|nr:hypothetical protein M8J75_001459 [Diaphorina citri]KAI5713783.1 hypothetical protein M8J76_005361 [Diaphorina citri]
MSSSKGRPGHLFKFIAILLVASVWICLRYGNRIRRFHRPSSRTFTVNYSANSFRMDGRPFRFVSGEFTSAVREKDGGRSFERSAPQG